MKFWTKIILDNIKNEIEPCAVCKNNDKFIKNKISNDNYQILVNEKNPLLKNKQIIKPFAFSNSALIKINKQIKIIKKYKIMVQFLRRINLWKSY